MPNKTRIRIASQRLKVVRERFPNIRNFTGANRISTTFSQEMKTTLIALLLLGWFILPEARAQSKAFEPVEGYFASFNFSHDYRTKVRDVLLKDASDSPEVMVVYLPSFHVESALVIQEHEPGDKLSTKKVNYELVEFTCAEPVYNHKDPKNIKVKKRSKMISKELAESANSLWFSALGTTTYPDESRDGLDGASYYYSAFHVGLGLRAGTAWMPEDGSLPSTLLDVAEQLRGLLGRKDTTAKEKELVAAIKRRLAETKKREQNDARRPATAPDSKSEDKEQPNPESEGRSQ